MKIWALLLLAVFGLPVQSKRKMSLVSQGTDCTKIKAASREAGSGVYVIQPQGVKKPFKVYCEMIAGKGWTVFQRRTGGTLAFNRTWTAYENGFGRPGKDQWLGLQKVFLLTKNHRWVLRVDLWDHEGGTAFAEYRDFRLGNKKRAYRLKVGPYRGSAGDAIDGSYAGISQNGLGFSTVDRDNDGCDPCYFGDIAESDCAQGDGGGWWYSRCGDAALNGDWHPNGDHVGWRSGLHWRTWKGPAPYSANATRMMIMSL